MRLSGYLLLLVVSSCAVPSSSPEFTTDSEKDIEALSSDDPEVRAAAVEALVAAGEPVRPAVQKALLSPDPEIVGRARQVICRLETAEEDRRRSFWRGKIRDVQASWGRPEIHDFIDQVRESNTRWPVSPNAAGYGYDGAPMTWFDLHSLDETFNLYVVWKGEDSAERGGIRSAEVVGFPDLRRHVEPDLFTPVSAIHRVLGPQDGWFDPVLLLRAVNALQPLGKEKAVRALQAYYDLTRRLSREDQHKFDLNEFRIQPVVEILFEAAQGTVRPRSSLDLRSALSAISPWRIPTAPPSLRVRPGTSRRTWTLRPRPGRCCAPNPSPRRLRRWKRSIGSLRPNVGAPWA